MTLASSAKKPSKTFDELMSTPIDFSAFIMNGLKINNLTQETLLGPAFRLLKGTRSNYAELEYDFEECYKALLEKLDWENPEGGDYPFDLTKPLPLVMSRNHQKVPVDYFFNNDLKYLQGGISTMTYTTSLTKIKAAQYDLPGIKDMVPNIWVPVKVAYDKPALWGISHWREQHKSFYGCARGPQSRHDVYSTKHILAEAGIALSKEQLAILADTRDKVDSLPGCDDISTAKAVLMANLSSYGSNVLSEAAVKDTNSSAQQDLMIQSVIEQMFEQMINHVTNWDKANKEANNESLTAELERYRKRVKTFEQRLNVDLSSHEKLIDSQMDDMIRDRLALKQQIDSLE
ncbi:hypothetical protein Tco_0386117 [Tanacetum coccineum]